MKERGWIGVAVAAVFFAGLFAGHLYPGARSRTLAVEQKTDGTKVALKVDELAREVYALSDKTNTGTVQTERTVRRAPDGTVEAHTTTARTFALRSYQREQEHEQARTVTEYVDRWHTDTKVSIVERLREPRWAVSALAGFSLDARAPVAAVQLSGHMFGPLELTVQVQRTLSGGPFDGWIALGGVTLRW